MANSNATATTPIRHAIVFDGQPVKNKVGTMYFGSEQDAFDAAHKLGLDLRHCEIATFSTKLLNTRLENEAHNVPTTEGKPKPQSQNAVEDACHVKAEAKKSKKWDTLYCIIGIIVDEQGENIPKVVHVQCNSPENAKEVAEYKYDMVPLAVMEGRLKGNVKEFIRQALTAVYADAE